MKLDPIFETKIIYFSEKVIELKSSEYILTSKEIDTYIDISDSERIINYLEKEKLIKRGYNNDFDTDGGLLDHSDVDRDGLRELIKKLKQNLRQKPAIERNLIVQVARQLEIIFDKNKWSSITSQFFSYDENDIYKYIKLERYSLTDFLFYSSYSKEFSIYDFLVEFLNPVYYDIKSEITPQKMFDFIDSSLKLYIIDKDYLIWRDKALKYIKLSKVGGAKKTKRGGCDILIAQGMLVCGEVNFPLESGQRQLFLKLKDNARIYKGGNLMNSGMNVNKNILKTVCSYKDDKSFRSALAKLRSKLNKSGLAVTIINEKRNHYIMIIKDLSIVVPSSTTK